MSYRNQQPINSTLIDDLPELDEGQDIIPDNSKYQKYIRNNNYTPYPGSGMKISSNNDQYKLGYHNSGNQGYYIDSIQPQKPLNYEKSSGGLAPNSQMYYEPFVTDTLNCKDIAIHTKNCYVCSRLYNNDKTIYIIIISILCIIIILLMKRILDI